MTVRDSLILGKGVFENMPPQTVATEIASKLQDAFRKTRRIMGMLQGTMGLEGQALDSETLRKMNAQTLLELFGKR